MTSPDPVLARLLAAMHGEEQPTTAEPTDEELASARAAGQALLARYGIALPEARDTAPSDDLLSRVLGSWTRELRLDLAGVRGAGQQAMAEGTPRGTFRLTEIEQAGAHRRVTWAAGDDEYGGHVVVRLARMGAGASDSRLEAAIGPSPQEWKRFVDDGDGDLHVRLPFEVDQTRGVVVDLHLRWVADGW